MEKVSSSNSQGVRVPKLRFPGFEGEWECVQFSDLFTYLSNNTLSRAELSNSGEVRNIHYGDVLIKYGDVIDIEHTVVPYVADAASLKKPDYLYTGDVVISDTAEDETVGKAVEIINSSQAAIVSGLHTIPCRPKRQFIPSYLGYYINSTPFHTQLFPYMQGIKVTSISKGNIGRTHISFPTLDEQYKITRMLNLLSLRIEKQRQLVEALKSYKRGVLSKLFPQNGETTPEYRFSGFTEPWKQHKLGELGEILTGSTPPTSHEEYYSDNGIPWVTPTDISENIIYATQRKLSDKGQKIARIAPKGTILVTCIASIGKNTMLGTAGSFNQQINALIPNFEKNSPYFLLTESILWSEKMKQQAAAGTMQIVNKTEFSELVTKVPCLEEQEVIGTYFKSLDHLITLHQSMLCKYERIKSGLLQQLFI